MVAFGLCHSHTWLLSVCTLRIAFTQQFIQFENRIPDCPPELVSSIERFSTPTNEIGPVAHQAPGTLVPRESLKTLQLGMYRAGVNETVLPLIAVTVTIGCCPRGLAVPLPRCPPESPRV